MTLWPPAWTSRVRERPKPDEHPVMSQVRFRLGMVKEAAMIAVVMMIDNYGTAFNKLFGNVVKKLSTVEGVKLI